MTTATRTITARPLTDTDRDFLTAEIAKIAAIDADLPEVWEAPLEALVHTVATLLEIDGHQVGSADYCFDSDGCSWGGIELRIDLVGRMQLIEEMPFERDDYLTTPDQLCALLEAQANEMLAKLAQF